MVQISIMNWKKLWGIPVAILCCIIQTVQTVSESNIRTQIVRNELSETGFHSSATANKPKITMCNAYCRLYRCKAHYH